MDLDNSATTKATVQVCLVAEMILYCARRQVPSVRYVTTFAAVPVVNYSASVQVSAASYATEVPLEYMYYSSASRTSSSAQDVPTALTVQVYHTRYDYSTRQLITIVSDVTTVTAVQVLLLHEM